MLGGGGKSRLETIDGKRFEIVKAFGLYHRFPGGGVTTFSDSNKTSTIQRLLFCSTIVSRTLDKINGGAGYICCATCSACKHDGL